MTRTGCNSICPNFGDGCSGCRGLLDESHDQVAHDVLAKHGLTVDDIIAKYDHYNAWVLADRQQKGE